jgi:tRNA dimethylallyltransferase
LKNPLLIITGPTASGKSALALAVAGGYRGAVINADSQQVYADVCVLSARPPSRDTALVPHHLYGHIDGATNYSTGDWLRELEHVLEACWAQGVLPIVTGGTGLYIKALMHGMAEMPAAPMELRQRGHALLEKIGLLAFAEELLHRDPLLVGTIDTQNPQRLMRAWELLELTGQSIRTWQKNTLLPFPQATIQAFALMPMRPILYRSIDDRVHDMVKGGALDEVKHLMARNLSPHLPVMKGQGVREFAAHLNGEITLEAAIADTQTHTRRYAKRQLTWLRNQIEEITWLSPEIAWETVREAAESLKN